MMYYTTVTGWMVNYFGKFLIGAFHAGMDTERLPAAFWRDAFEPGEMALWTELVVIAGFLDLLASVFRTVWSASQRA